MSDSATPGSPPSHNTNMVRNIIAGVTTTVVGATFVFFLNRNNHNNNDNNSSNGSYLEVKEATTKGWKSYVAIENLEYKNTMLLANHLKDLNGLDEFKDQLTKESNKFSSDIEDLQKTKNLDDGFIALLKRRLDAEKEALEKWSSFFTKSSDIINSTQPGQDRNDRITVEYNKMQAGGNFIVEKTKTEITDLSKSLSEKYGQQFAITDLILFQDKKQDNTNNINNTTTNNNNNTGTQGNDNNATVTNTNNNPSDNTVNNYNRNNTNYTNNNSSQDNVKSLVGEWDTQGAVITLSSNGRMTWEMTTGQNTSGNWQYYNSQLYMTYPNQYGVSGTYVFNLSNVRPNSFTMVLTTYPYYRYDLTRYTDN